MKYNLLPHFTFLTFLLVYSSCISGSKVSYQTTADIRKGGAIKVINPNSQDIMLGKIEHALLSARWTVISDNRLRGFVPTGGMITVSAPDTTYSIPQRQSLEIRLFEEKATDYVLRYQYQTAFAWGKLSFRSFTATLIDVGTGQIVGSFDYRQRSGWGKRRVEKVLMEMAQTLKN